MGITSEQSPQQSAAARSPADLLARPVVVHAEPAPNPSPIDALMERASAALVRADYFTCEALCGRAIERCRRSGDWDRFRRAVLPLQEARRQIRQLATDAGFAGVLKALPSRGAPLAPGIYLIEPPLIGADARTLRSLAVGRRVPVMVLAKEPTTRSGKWPIVGVGTALGGGLPAVIRVQVDPPEGNAPNIAWALATQEALGDAAIAKVEHGRKLLGWPADHRVDDLLEYLEAVPDHEKLCQALEATAIEAAKSPASTRPRRRGAADDPFSF